MRVVVAGIAAALAVTGCSSGQSPGESQDPSKMTEDLEKRAVEIEEKADQAVLAVERDAQAELERLQSAQSEADANRAADEAGEREARRGEPATRSPASPTR